MLIRRDAGVLFAFTMLLCVSGACHSALGQSSNFYLVAGVGSVDKKTVSQAGLGGEFIVRGPVGAGVEIGAVAGHSSFATFSVNGYYHIPVSGLETRATPRRVDPFATVGYTLGGALFGGTANMLNLGGGLHYWFHRRIGLRLEGRDLVHSGWLNGSTQLWTFRGGVAFR